VAVACRVEEARACVDWGGAGRDARLSASQVSAQPTRNAVR
jgi:hypothetical protein